MADLRSTSTIAGNIIWHAGNLKFDIEDDHIYFEGYKIYTENDKPTASEINVFTKEESDARFAPITNGGYLELSGGTMTGLLKADANISITNSNPDITLNNNDDSQSFSLHNSGRQFKIRDDNGSEDLIVIDPTNNYVSVTQPLFKVNSLTMFDASNTNSLEIDPNNSFQQININNVLNVNSELKVNSGSVLNVTDSSFTYNGSEVFNATDYSTLDNRYLLSNISTNQYLLLLNQTNTGALKLNGDGSVSSADSSKYSTIRPYGGDLTINPTDNGSLLLNYFSGSMVKFGDGNISTAAYIGNDGLLYQGDPDGNHYKYWNENNMGSGSGLNSDLLDDKEGSYYLTGSNITTASESAQGTIVIASENEAKIGTNYTHAMTPLRVSQYASQFGITDSINTTGDWDQFSNGFIHRYGSTNVPSGFDPNFGYYGFGVFNPFKTYGSEFLSKSSNPSDISVRSLSDGSWKSTVKLLNTGNMGPGSNIDADLLDNKQGSFYTNASNLNSGTISDSRLPDTITSNIAGNSATATKLTSNRLISLSGDVTGSQRFDGSRDITIDTKSNTRGVLTNATLGGKHFYHIGTMTDLANDSSFSFFLGNTGNYVSPIRGNWLIQGGCRGNNPWVKAVALGGVQGDRGLHLYTRNVNDTSIDVYLLVYGYQSVINYIKIASNHFNWDMTKISSLPDDAVDTNTYIATSWDGENLPKATDKNALDGLTSGVLSAEQLKSAMDQFGQFGYAKNLPSGTSLNQDFEAGLYNCINFADSPISGWCYLRVDRHSQSGQFLIQRLSTLTGSEKNFYIRTIFSGDFSGPWKKDWNEYTLPIPTEAQAQDQNSTIPYAWTPQRVAQAIDSRSVGEAQVFEAVYPVGSVYTNYSNSANPNTYLKGGGNSSWTKIEGRVVVGVGSVDGTTFNAGSTGGEVNHQLTIAEMPSHNHNILMAQGSDSSFVWGRVGNGAPGKKYRTETTAIQNEGGDGSHNNMQPYITCYVWRRTA